MSLLDDFKTACAFMEKERTPDGEGGFYVNWTQGAKFQAAIVLDTSIEAVAAEKQGVTGVYTVTIPRSMNLEYHDVFKRLYDGKTFRVTSDGDDKYTPKSATLDMRQVRAEEWELTE